jgi:lipopolysaccharide export system protein LptA
MNKNLAMICAAAVFGGATSLGQGSQSDIDLFKKIDQMSISGSEKPATDAKAADDKPKEPTIITATKETTFDAKLNMAVFNGDVNIQSPQFALNADKLTVYFKKQEKAKPGDVPKPPAKAKSAAPDANSAVQGSGGLDRALAEGNVVIVSDRPDSNGGPPVHYVGKGARVDYNAVTGEAVFHGWPQVQQGINTIISTEESTVIHLFRDGKMKIEGSHKVNINDPGPDKSQGAK